MRNKSLYLILICICVFALVACGSPRDDDDDGTPDQNDTNATSESQVADIILTANPPSVTADGESNSTIQAEIVNSNGNPVSNETITFSVQEGKLSDYSKRSSKNGIATVIYTAPASLPEDQTDTIEVRAANDNDASIDIDLQKKSGATVSSLSLTTDKTSVPSDNSEPAIITAIAKNDNNIAIENMKIEFRASEGLLNKGLVRTDSNGEAAVEFSSGKTDPANHVATIFASTSNRTQQIPIKITGTKMGIDTGDSTLKFGGNEVTDLTVTLKDASQIGINGVKVNATLKDSFNVIELSNSTTSGRTVSGTTDANGEFTFEVRANATGKATVEVSSLGITQQRNYEVLSRDKEIHIQTPSTSPIAITTADTIDINASLTGNIDKVKFTTTIGSWSDSNKTSSNVTNFSGNDWNASKQYSSNDIGLATVEVFESGNPAIKDSIQIACSAPRDQAGKVNLQLSASNVLPSTGNIKNTVDVTANVWTTTNDPVANAPVLFSLHNSTGGGEFLSPNIVYTDSSGQAKTVFTSGSRSSGHEELTIRAEVLDSEVSDNITDNKSLTIGGTAGSISIGRSTKVQSIAQETSYSLPMSVLVTDSNGNAMANTKVNLSTWPTRFRTGYWDDDYIPVTNSTFQNEDQNRNLILDSGEDCVDCGYIADDELTPPQAAAGSVPDSVITNEHGLATFQLQYPKQYAVWVQTEIKASTEVLGTESISKWKDWLPFAEGDEPHLPNSPFNPADSCMD